MHDINLLPWREQQQSENKRRFLSLLVLGVGMVFALQWAGNIYLKHLQNNQQTRNQKLKSYVLQLDDNLKKMNEIKVEEMSILTRLNLVESLQHERNNTTDLMNFMSKLTPFGVYFDKIQLTHNDRSQGIVSISGIADNTSRLALMLNNFETSPEVSDVTMHSIISGKMIHNQKFQSFNLSFHFLNQAKPQVETNPKYDK